MAYDILYLREVTATTATFGLNDGEQGGTGETVSLYDQAKATVLQTAIVDSQGLVTFTGLTPETTYYAYYVDAGYEEATTSSDNPRIALESQWADLANRIKTLQNGGNFTTSEVDTGCTWINGEKIYKKTIITGDLSGTGTLEKDHNIANFSFPVAFQGFALDGNAGEFRTLPYVRGEDMTVTGIGIAITPTKIRIMRNASYNINNSWVTIWYTKSS